jgi:hypothetical protein
MISVAASFPTPAFSGRKSSQVLPSLAHVSAPERFDPRMREPQKKGRSTGGLIKVCYGDETAPLRKEPFQLQITFRSWEYL